MNLGKIRKKIAPILKDYGVHRAGIFGSAARGTMKKTSDIDLLVEIRGPMSLLDFVGLKLDLEKAIGKKVDLGEYRSIKPALKKSILKEEVSLL